MLHFFHQELAEYKKEYSKSAAVPLLEAELWSELKSLQDIEGALSKVGAEPCHDVAHLKASSDSWMTSKRPIQQVLALVTSAVAGFTRAKQTVQKDAEAREKKEKARAERAAAAALKEAGRKTPRPAPPGKKSKVDGEHTWAIRKVSMEHHPSIMEPDSPSGADFSRPWVVRQCPLVPELMNMAPAKLNFLIFKTGFARSVAPAEQRVLKSAEAIRGTFAEAFGPPNRLMEGEHEESSATVGECLLWAIRGGVDRVSAVQNGLGGLYAVASERASYQVLLALCTIKRTPPPHPNTVWHCWLDSKLQAVIKKGWSGRFA